MSRIAVLDRFLHRFFYAVFAALLGGSCVGECVACFATFAFADERFHLALVVLVVPTSIVALGLGCRLHRSRRIPVFGLGGILLLSCGPQRQAVNVSVNSEKRRSRCLEPALLRWLIG